MSIRRYVGLCLGVLFLLAAPALAQTVSFVDANGSAVSTYLEGTRVHVRVEDPAANTYPWSAETVSVYLSTSLSGDSEILTLTETDRDTGVFEGSMALDFEPSSPYQPDVLETSLQSGPPVVRDTLTAQYNSASDTAGMVAGRIGLLDDLGRPAAGYTQGDLVRVRLEDHLRYNDPGTRDSVLVAVNVLAVSDEEFITLQETGNNTSIFEGSIPAALYATYDGDGVVGAPAGNQVHAQHSVGTVDEWLDAYAPLVGSRAEILDRAGNPADFVAESSTIRLRAVDRTIGSPTMADTVQAGVSSLLGADQETVTLTETGSETGVYEADLPTRFNIVDPTVLGNGRLETGEDAGPPHSFDTITLSYNGPSGASSDTAATYGSETFFIDEWGNDAEIFATGATVFVRVIDYNYDQSAALDSISAAVSGLTRGDNEYVNLVETGSHTGVFEGSLPIQYQFYSVTSYDGWLQAEPGETIEARHTDALGSTASADRAVIRYSDIHFFDAQGRPTNEVVEGGWASIRLYNFSVNYSTYSVDTTTVRVRSLLGSDMEFLTVTETGTNTGIFEGTIRLVFSPGASGGNGTLEVSNGGSPGYAQDTVTADAADALATATTVGARVWLIDRFGQDAEIFAAGDLVGIRVEDHNADDPQARQTLQVVAITNPETGDVESVNALETGYATGIFEGTVPSWLLPYFTANDGYLQVQAGDRLEGRHVWMHSPRIAVDSAVFTGSSVLFVDGIGGGGQPVESYLEATTAYVRLVYAGGNVTPSADGVPVTVSTAISLDSETLILTETGGNTGVFTGSIPIGNPGFVTPTPGNYVLETGRRTGPTELDTLTVTHTWSGGSASDTAAMINSRTWFVDAAGNPTDEYARDTRAYIRVEDHILDSSPTSYDVAQVTLRSLSTGDQETFYLQETGMSTGVFAGSMELDAVINGTTFAYPGDGKLQSDAGEEIEVLHEEWGVVASSSDRARIEYASVEFVDQAGQATLELLEGGVARLRVFEPYNSYGGTLGVYVQSRYGDDEEPVTLTETAYQSRVYEGTIQLRSVAPGGAVSSNGTLETSTSGSPEYRADEVTASYGGDQALALTVPSRVTFIDSFGRAASSFAVTERAGVRVEDHNLDNPLTRGTVTVNVTASSGDAESVVLTETGYDTNLFEGSVVLSSGGLTVQAGDVIRAQHGNLTRPTPTTAEATVTGSRIQFEDEAGQPADVYLEGSEVWVRVVDSSAAGSISVTATLRTALGPDVETIFLTETAPGVFLGSMALGTNPAVVNDNVLTTVQYQGPPHEFDRLEVRYNADLSVMDTAATVSSRTWFVDAAGNPADKYSRESRAYVRVEDHVASQPGVYDSVQVTLRSLTTGDQETLYIQETTRDGGIFAGSIELDAVINGTTYPNPGDGKLQAEAGEDIEVVHTDWAGYSSSSDRARITYAAVVFVDEAGEATVELLEGGVARLRVFEPYNSYGSTLGVYVQSRYGDDEEPVTLTETAYQSRVYEGTIQLRSVAPGGAVSNGTLETSTSGSPEYRADEVTANYGGDQALALTVPSRVMFVDGFGQVVSSFGVGEAVGVRVVDNNLDDPVVRRSVMVNVRSLAGDSENVTLTETGYDTNVYEGSIATQSGTPAGGNGALQVQAGDVIEAEHANQTTPNPTVAQATITGASVLFVDADGQPAETYFEASVAYVRVTDITATGSVTATVQALLAGDNESVTLTQTGPSVFEGSVPLRLWPSVEPNSGFIETRQDAGPPHEYDTLRVTYQSSAGAVTDTAGTLNSRAWFVDALGNPADKYARDSRAYVRVEDHIDDNPGVYDAIQVTLRSLSTGDQETLYIQETARSGGLFAGSIELDAVINGTTFPIPGDGKLQAEAGEDIEVVHTSWLGSTTASDRARITYASVVFVDEAGQATLELLEGGVARLRVFEPYNSYGGSVGVYVQSRYGDDEEPVTLTETAYQSRVYEGTIQLRSVAPGGAVSSNGTLETSTSGSPEYRADEVTANYGGDQALALTVPSRVMFVDGFGQVVSSFGVGEAVGVRVVDNNLDDPVVRRSVMVNVRSLAGDSENVTLTETGYDTNVYEGSIATQSGTPASGNGALQVQAGGVIEAEHANQTTPNPTVAQATVSGASVLFVDANGQPAETYFEASVAYVRVTDITATGSVTATVQALLAGDTESVTLTQTGPSVFEGSVPLRLWPSVEPNSGFIETRQDAGPPHEYDTLRVTYQSSAGAVTDTAGTLNSRAWFVDAAGNPTDKYSRESRAYVRVEDHIDDNPGVYDAIQVTLRSLTTGDQETLYIQETARSGGLFAGSIELDAVINGTTTPIPGDGKLQAEAGEDIELVHANWPGAPTSSDRARITYASVVFVDEAGEVTLELLEGGVARLRVFEPYNSYGGSVGVYVQSRYGDDEEPVTLTETAYQSRVYEGTIQLRSVAPGGAVSNGVLETSTSGSPEYRADEVSAYYGGDQALALTVPSRVVFVDGFGQVVSSFGVGDAVGVRVVDNNLDDPVVRRSVMVNVRSLAGGTGDTENVTLTETGYDTNVYEGSIATQSGTPANGNGALQVQAGDVIEAEHGNQTTPNPTVAQATITGASVLFVDANGQPAETYFEASAAYVRVTDISATGSVTATVQALLAGDNESVTLTQTGPSVFEGSVPLRIWPSVEPNSGFIETRQDTGPPHEYDTLRVIYQSSAGAVTDTAGTINSRTWFVDAAGNPADGYARGSRAYVRVEDHILDHPGVQDAAQVTLRSLTTGDLETLYLQEVADGIFEGSLALETNVFGQTYPSHGDGKLQSVAAEEIEVVHDDMGLGTSSSDRAAILFASVEFVDAVGVVTTELLEGGVARLRVFDIENNYGGGTVGVWVQSLYGDDEEPVTLTETAYQSHIYEGTVQLRSVAPGSAVSSNSVLETSTSGSPEYRPDEVTAFYGGDQAVALTVPSRARFLDLEGQVVTGYAVGSQVRVRVEDHNAGSAGQVDSVMVNLATPTDSENVTLTETGADTGIFEGGIDPGSGSGVLDAAPGTTVTVTHSNVTTPNPTLAQAVFSGNFAPLAVDDTAETEEAPVTIPVLANDSDPDAESLQVTAVTQGANGAVVINADQTVTYTPAAEFLGTDTFTYVASDPRGGQSRATVTVTVTSANHPPTPAADNVTTPEDQAISIAVLANDTDPDDDPLEVIGSGIPSNGTAERQPDGTILYTPENNWSGQVSFTYMVRDPEGLTAYAQVTVTVAPVNDPPVAADDEVAVAEDGGATVVNATGNDYDIENDALLVTAVTQGTSGVVVLNAYGDVTYAPNANFHGTDSFTYTLSDGNGGTDTATVAVTVTPVNDAPVGEDDTATTDEDTPVTINVLANDSDPDGDVLDVTYTTGVIGYAVVNADNTITFTPAQDASGTVTFSYAYTDGTVTGYADVTVTINPVNDAPVAVDDSTEVAEDSSATVWVLANDSDAEGDTLDVTAVTQGANGAVVLNGDDTVTYTPNANFNGSDSFTYTLSDGNGGTDTATVTVTVVAANDAPVADDDTATTSEDTPVTVSVLANDTDPDNDTLTVSAVTQGTSGSVAIVGSSQVTYTPNANFHGTDSFTYTVSDGNGGTDTATVTVTIGSVNDGPVANDDAATVAEDSSVSVTVLANDSDADGDTLDVTAVTQGANGAVVLNADETATYTPNANFHGSDSFTYTVADGSGGTDTATVSVTVTSANDAPVANDDTATTPEDTPVTVSVLANDSDLDGDTLTVSAVTQGTNGSVAIVGGIGGSQVTYTPNANFHGTDSFTYTANDGNGGTDTATVTMTINPTNDAPVAADDTASVVEDDSVAVAVLGNDSDVDGDSLTITAVTQGAHGAVAITGSTVTYTPAPNYNGADAFTYTISDGNGGSDTATVSMTVTASNDALTAVDDTATVAEDGSVTVAVLANDTDPENDPLTVVSVTQGTNGAVAIVSNQVTYTPNADFNGTDSFTYTASDGNGGTGGATVTVTVTPVNDAPVAGDDTATVVEDGSVTISVLGDDTDVDGDTLVVTAVTQGTNGTVVIVGSSQVTYTPAVDFHGTDSFTYTISDGNGGTDTANVTVTVGAANDAPVANNDSASTAEDTAVSISVLANDTDLDGDTLSVASVTQGANGAVTISGTQVVYTPGADFHGSDSFTYTASDGNGGTATATVNVTITPVNDAPVAAADTATVAEDGSVAVSVRSNDTDVDGDAVTITAVTQGANGAVTHNGSTVTYTPAANYNGPDSFTYTIGDGNGGSALGTVTVNVTGTNDAPVAVNDSASVAEDGSVVISVRSNDSDLDGDTLTITAVTQGANGSVTHNGSTVTYTPNANYNGSNSFTYTISDGNGGTATASVAVTVTPVNDAPVAVNDTATTLAEVAVTVNVRANDTDVDSPTLTVTAVTQGANGSVSISSEVGVTYTPAAGWVGPDSFTYTISDGAGGTATATVNVTVQAPARVTGNLQVLYTFNEGSGTTVNDVSGVGSPYNLTISNSSAVTWLPGALSLNSPVLVQSASNATKVINACKSSNEVTIEAWVAPDNTTQSGPAVIASIAQNTTKRNVTLGQSGTAYNGQLRTSSTSQAGTQLNTGAVATTNLAHVVYTRSSTGAVRIYVNGTQVASSTLTGNFSGWSNYSLALGGEPNGSRYWVGDMHLVAIYSRALTAAEARQNWLAGAN